MFTNIFKALKIRLYTLGILKNGWTSQGINKITGISLDPDGFNAQNWNAKVSID